MQKYESLVLQTENDILHEKLLELNSIYKITKSKINKFIASINQKLLNIIFLQNLEDKIDYEKLVIQYTIMMNNTIINKLHT